MSIWTQKIDEIDRQRKELTNYYMRQAGDKHGSVHFGKHAIREKPVKNEEGYRHKKADDESIGQKSLADDVEIQRLCQLC